MWDKRYLWVLIFLFVFWTSLVLYGSLAPSEKLPPSGLFDWIPYFDKVVHFVFYAGEVTLLLLLFSPRRWWVRLMFVFMVCLFSAGIEILQGAYFGRQNDIYDLISNSLGAFSGLLFFRLVTFFFKKFWRIENLPYICSRKRD